MTNSIAVVLGALILVAVGANFLMGWEFHIFLGQRFLGLTEWLAFWR